MCGAPSTCRARKWLIEPRFFSAEYNGLIAAPGTPNAHTTPSFSRIRTAASIARIFAIFETSLMFLNVIITATTDDLNGVEYVSRDVEWLVKSAPDQIVGCIAQ